MPKELERRLAAHTASPEDVAPWEEVKAQALGQSAAMSLPIVLQPEALVEFDDAFNWYEQRRLGLGFQEYP